MQSETLDASINQSSDSLDESNLTRQFLNESMFAIQGRNLKKTVKRNTYGIYKNNETVLLSNVNIHITKGKIYGLLGPSGCGKTTLLKCLIGLDTINEGVIHVNNELRSQFNFSKLNLNKLGFMPQDCCLYTDLTLTESFYYFGKLYCMTNDQIKSKQMFLVNLLDLPIKNQLVESLSGGQLRRLSLAISLLNNPKILMLDEPTVGVDPILRKKIWDFLIQISEEQQTTVIITTHYIEEAKKAHCLGFMRNGSIIEENSPQYLMKKYKEAVLEDVFYSISVDKELHYTQKQISNHKSNFDTVSMDSKNFDITFNIPKQKSISGKIQQSLKKKFGFSFDRLGGNLYKDTKKVLRNKKLLLVQFLIPIIQITFFYLCIGQKPNDLVIGVINNDTTYTNKWLDLKINFGNQVLKKLENESMIQKHFINFKEAYQELKIGNIWALLNVDKNFTSEIMSAVSKKELPDRFTSHMKVYLDNTNYQISYTIKEQILKAIRDIVLNYNADYNDYSIADYPLIFEKPVYGEENPSFTNFMAPGIALSVIFFLSVASTASNYVLERQLGLIERSYLAGVKTVELLLSQLIVYTVIMLIQIGIVLCLLFVFLKLPMIGSFPLLVWLLSSQGFCGLCYGLCLAAFFYDQETVLQVTLASFYPILLMSGIIWPLEAQPALLKNYISNFLPLTYATESFRYILEKGWGLENYFVLRGFISTYIWTTLFCACFLFLFSCKTNKSTKF